MPKAKVYGLYLESDRPYGEAYLNLYSEANDYGVSLSGLSPGQPIFVTLPALDPIYAVSVEDILAPGSTSQPCTPPFTFSDFYQARMRAGFSTPEETRVLSAQLRQALLDGAPAIPALVTIGRTSANGFGCSKPYVAATTLRGFRPAATLARGMTVVKVQLDETGAVVATSIYRSSRNAQLDRNALDAARRSTFAPELFRCRPVGGAYLFEVVF